MPEPDAVEAFESPSPSQSTSGEKPRARTFREVQHDELEAIHHLRQTRDRGSSPHGGPPSPEPVPSRSEAPDAIDRAHRSGLVGLSCSGGGIRSATFNLGVVQGLARLGLLSRLDYLSTNSGGGFLGGWLVAWMKRTGARRVEAELGSTGTGDAPEPKPLRFLRAFSNYLTPRVGAFSADNWTLIATYLRNLFLNLLVLVLALAAILLIPRLLLLISDGVGDVTEAWALWGLPFPLLLATLFLAVGIFFLGRNQMRLFPRPDRSPPPWYARQAGVQVTVVLPLLLAAWAGGLWMWFSVPADALSATGDETGWRKLLQEAGLAISGGGAFADLPAWVVLPALGYTALWLVGYLVFLLGGLRGQPKDSLRSRRQRLWQWSLATALPAGAGGGFMLWLLLEGTRELPRLLVPEGIDPSVHLLHVTALRGPLIVLVFMLTAFLHTGLLGREFPESLRQWWSRLGAWLLIYSLTWVTLCALAFYGGMALELLSSTVVVGLAFAWLGSTLVGLLAGKQPASLDGPTRLQKLVAGVVPYVFIVGLLALLSFDLQLLLSPPFSELTEDCRELWTQPVGDEPYLERAHRVVGCHSELVWRGTGPIGVPLLWLLFTGSALLLSWRVDINEFSMHLFYRNRLIRAYLGASNPDRQAQSFTGFDPEDDLDLAQLVPRGMEPPRCPEASSSRAARSALTHASTYDGPYPILNLTLNLVQGEELAWQERKGASFVCTPLYTGYPHESIGEPDQDPASPLENAGFRPTRCYLETPPRQGISLGAAMAISGAAASPNQGAGSTPAMAFLLTVFNVRLGWWLGNPRHRDTWNRMGPRVGLLTLLAELFGYSGEDSRYVHLSDGGHFDNCALYEMVRRRAKLIVSTDAGADPELAFSDIANVIRKCWVDFGIEIELETRSISDGRAHCAVGRIRYDRVDPGAEPGWILFLKASLTGDEPRDIQSYAVAHPAFPHESTADQWFSESQLESYRKLGQHIALAAFQPLSPDGEEGRARLSEAVRGLTTRELFEKLHDAWDAPSKPKGPED